MNCEFCGKEFEKLRNLLDPNFKMAVCYNVDCDKYAIPQTIEIKPEETKE